MVAALQIRPPKITSSLNGIILSKAEFLTKINRLIRYGDFRATVLYLFPYSATIPEFNNTQHKYLENSTSLNIDVRKGELIIVEGNGLKILNFISNFQSLR